MYFHASALNSNTNKIHFTRFLSVLFRFVPGTDSGVPYDYDSPYHMISHPSDVYKQNCNYLALSGISILLCELVSRDKQFINCRNVTAA